MPTNTANYTAVQRDITVVLQQSIMAATPFYPLISSVVPSQGSDEKYAWLGAMPTVREWVGDRIFQQIRAAEYILPNIHWESSLEVPRTVVDDDRMGTLRTTLMQLGQEAALHPDSLMVEAMVNGDTRPCFDGQNFFDTDHAWGDSGSQSNKLTHQLSTPDQITPEEFRAAFHEALIAMLSFKQDNGEYFFRPTVGNINDLVVAVPIQLLLVAQQAFNQTLTVDAGAAPVTNVVLARPQIVGVQGLGDTAKGGSDRIFHLYHTGQGLMPYVFQAREPLRVQTKGSEDIEFNAFKVMTEARYNVGYLAWWTAVSMELVN